MSKVLRGKWDGDNLPGQAHTGNGSSSGGDGMDTRIINLERDMTDVKVALGKVETRLENIENTMLTRGRMAVYALLGAMGALGGAWWVIQQYLAPILTRLPPLAG